MYHFFLKKKKKTGAAKLLQPQTSIDSQKDYKIKEGGPNQNPQKANPQT
jgi:hypothetical protein